jgi:hypothetical protein
MNTNTELDQLLKLAAETKAERVLLEERLETCRRTSRDCAIALVFNYGYSVLKTSNVLGHMRSTVKTWVMAEIATRAANGEEIPGNAGTIDWSHGTR